jgi:hypothetical protein
MKRLLFALGLIAPMMVSAAAKYEPSEAEFNAFLTLSASHAGQYGGRKINGCYDLQGKPVTEGETTEVEGFKFVCISQSAEEPSGDLAELSPLATGSGTISPGDTIHLWMFEAVVR